jgi:hypothetical protein
MCLPSNLVHLYEIRSRAYVSPVIIYFPVSPVAPPNNITLDLETIDHVNINFRKIGTLCYCVTKSSEWNLTENLNFLHISLKTKVFELYKK